ncbi:phosphoribosylanthranilate isomerase [Thermococcus sp.]
MVNFIKICGIRTTDELRLVERYADATGVVVNSKSPHRLPLRTAGELIKRSRIPVFLVSTMISFPEWANTIEKTGAEHIQIHTDVQPATVEKLKNEYGVFIAKAFKVPRKSNDPAADAEDLLRRIELYELDRIILDTGAGTGLTHDLRVTKLVAKEVPVIIAGGLNPNNVGKIVRFVRPWGVDVSSGVEREGVKDESLIRTFVEAVKNVVR